MSETALKLLLERRSVVANKLGPPGPDAGQLRRILSVAARVPDHKRLVPWRFILFQGEARAAFGEVLARACKMAEADASDARLEVEAARFERAPVVVAVISKITAKPAVPEWEQILSAGAVCQNMLSAANASGFSAQWITEWYAYDQQVCAALALEEGERVAGFVYIGTAQEPPEERDRPDLDEITTSWAAAK
ncbi:MAG: nitroreductase [Proteobacteria bacterium]|nr:nitroreductase [Pseudomonadota bacterium]